MKKAIPLNEGAVVIDYYHVVDRRPTPEQPSTRENKIQTVVIYRNNGEVFVFGRNELDVIILAVQEIRTEDVEMLTYDEWLEEQ